LALPSHGKAELGVSPHLGVLLRRHACDPRPVVDPAEGDTEWDPAVYSLPLDVLDLCVNGAREVCSPSDLNRRIRDTVDVTDVILAACSERTTDVRKPE
jgi:hypothetical protein